MISGSQKTCLPTRGLVACWTSVLLLFAAVVFLGSTPALADPGDFEVELFSGQNYTGKSVVFALDANKSQQSHKVILKMYPPSIKSVKVGKKVGALLEKGPGWEPPYITNVVLTDDTPSLSENLRQTSDVVIFNKGANKGVLPNGKVRWERPRPDGVQLSKYSENTLVGGTNPEVWHNFFLPFEYYRPDSDMSGAAIFAIKNNNLTWVQVWGKTTYLKISDQAGHTKTYTTNGKDEAEYDMEVTSIIENLAKVEVGTKEFDNLYGNAAVDPAATRARWEYKNICFKQFANGIWVEFQSENPTYWFKEVERKPEYVELYDKDRNIRLQLFADKMNMLNPKSSSNYMLLYSGGAWRDYRDFWLVTPGHYFKKTQGNSWEEYSNGQKIFSFTESQHTPESVELHDASRNVWVQLGEKLAKIRKDNAAAPWQPLGYGKWDFAEAPEQTGQAGQGGSVGPPPATITTSDLAGTWSSNIGAEYQIQQNGMDFTWNAPKFNQTATGKFLATNEVTAQWSGAAGNESATGKLAQFDSQGKPTRIEWSNGVVFTRTGAKPQPQPGGGPLQGVWSSNIGAEYHIQQNGMNFTWKAPKFNQTATGKFLAANEVTAQWSGAAGNESATGKLTQFDSTGKATRIEWSNGVVFTRSSEAAPPQPVGGPLEGTWISNAGIEYHMKQTKMSFTWSAPKLKETAQGTVLPSNMLDVKWSGQAGSGSAKGKITQYDGTGSPIRIEWDNGVVFTRK